MDIRKLVGLALIIVLVAATGFVVVNGAAWDIYEFRPLHEQIPRGLDLTGGVTVVYEATDLANETLSADMDAVYTIMRMRLDQEGYTEATISRQGTGRLRIEIPINASNMVDDPGAVTQYLVKPAKLEFRDPEGNKVFGGEDMVDVGATINPDVSANPAGYSGQYAVAFRLNDTAAAAFEAKTAELAARIDDENKYIAIVLDDVVISSPNVSNAIPGGEAVITSPDFDDYEAANRLAQQIRSGALPIEMEEIEVRSVSGTLGEEALDRGLLAGLIGIALIFVFMVAYYRLPGLIASIALVIYIIAVLFCLATIPGVQLTLPGIAGIILSIGMAVDANVIIFERMREEIRAGKSVRTAVKLGFERAFAAIMDSNITTIIAALVLLFFGTGSIKGFAMTLLIGVIVSFFTAVFVTRGLLHLILGFHFKNKSWFCPMRKLAGGQSK